MRKAVLFIVFLLSVLFGFTACDFLAQLFNAAPTVELAAASATVAWNESTTLTAAAVDPDGDTLTYAWTIDGVAIAGQTASTLTVESDEPATATTHTYGVSVSDGIAAAATDEIQITFLGLANSAPTVSLSATSTSLEWFESTTLTATASDVDGNSLTYAWYVDDVVQPGATGTTFTFESDRPLNTATHAVKVTVSDAVATPVEATTTLTFQGNRRQVSRYSFSTGLWTNISATLPNNTIAIMTFPSSLGVYCLTSEDHVFFYRNLDLTSAVSDTLITRISADQILTNAFALGSVVVLCDYSNRTYFWDMVNSEITPNTTEFELPSTALVDILDTFGDYIPILSSDPNYTQICALLSDHMVRTLFFTGVGVQTEWRDTLFTVPADCLDIIFTDDLLFYALRSDYCVYSYDDASETWLDSGINAPVGSVQLSAITDGFLARY